jgi:hypothetical protein
MAQFGRGSVRKFFRGDPNLVGNWSFDEGIGTIAKDLSGKGNNGTLINSPTWKNGIFNNTCLYFNGVNNYVEVSRNSSFEPANEITVMAWVLNPTNQARSVVHHWFGYTLEFLDQNSDGIHEAGFVIYTSGSGAKHLPSSIRPIFNKWLLLVGTYSSYLGKQILYENGIKTAEQNASGTLVYSNVPLRFASRSDTLQYFNGAIDEVAIFSRALSPREIQSYYNWAISKSTPIIYTPRKNVALMNVSEAGAVIKARRGIIMSM